MEKKRARHLNLFITGTGTGVGKTHLSAELAKQALKKSLEVCYYKIIETGVTKTPIDENTVKNKVKDVRLMTKTLLTFKKAASPHFAASLENKTIDFRQLINEAKGLPCRDLTLWEGVGGALVPINSKYCIIDLAKALSAEIVIVGRAGLGALNEMLMTIECIQRRRLKINKIVLNMGIETNLDPIIVDNNVETISQKTGLPVEKLF